MGANSGIAWCHHTFNPWVGCTKVSAACDHCYAESWAKRTGQSGLWAGERRRTTASNWHQPVKWNKAALAAGVRHRVFCASLADVFDNQVPEEWRHDLWTLISQCHGLDWLLLTKRPQNIRKMLPDGWPWGHVWLGTTAEDQHTWDTRLEDLCLVPAAVHFVSVEPQLEPISGGNAFDPAPEDSPYHPLDWVIVGGESGPKARPFYLSWAKDFIDQTRNTDTACFIKQIGSIALDDSSYDGNYPRLMTKDSKGGDPMEWPEELRVREFPNA